MDFVIRTQNPFCGEMDAFREPGLSSSQGTVSTEMKFLKLLDLIWGIHV